MKAILKSILLTFCSAFIAITASGQEAGVMTLHGHVVDGAGSESLFFSSVSLNGTRISNVSNSDGVFSLKIPADTPGDAQIAISHLGFMTRTLKVSDFAGSTQERPPRPRRS